MNVACCPVCCGRGKVPQGFYDTLTPATGAPLSESCRACREVGYVEGVAAAIAPWMWFLTIPYVPYAPWIPPPQVIYAHENIFTCHKDGTQLMHEEAL